MEGFLYELRQILLAMIANSSFYQFHFLFPCKKMNAIVILVLQVGFL